MSLLLLFQTAGAASYVYTGSGGFTIAGSAAWVKGKTYVAAGGYTLSGAAIISKEKRYAGAGGFALSGSASLAKGKVYVGTGGLTFSGSAAVEFGAGATSYVYAGTGGIVFGGSAAVQFQPGAQPSADGGTWRKLTGEYPKSRMRRAPAIEPAVLPPAPGVQAPQAPARPQLRVVVAGDSPIRDKILGELAAPIAPRRRRLDEDADLAIALLLAA